MTRMIDRRLTTYPNPPPTVAHNTTVKAHHPNGTDSAKPPTNAITKPTRVPKIAPGAHPKGLSDSHTSAPS
jgi:hypothetical protein